MLQAIGNFLTERFRRWMPDAFVFAVGLTLLTAGLALVFTDAGPVAILDGWYRGFWQLLAFGMQMVLMLSTGFAIALSPAVARLIDWIAHHVNSPNRVYVAIVVIGGLFSLVSWGWLVLTAVLARELAQRVRGLDYAFLTAVVYFSSQPWVGGLSSSIPLLLNTPGNFLIEQGTLDSTVSVATTLGSRLNAAYLAMYFLVFPVLMLVLKPRGAREMSALSRTESAVPISVIDEARDETGAEATLSNRLNQSRMLALLLALAGFAYISRHFATRGFDIDLNIMIFIFAAVGFVRFWKNLRSGAPPSRISFMSAAVGTLGEIFSHSKFRDCGENHARAIGHLLLFFGFIGAMITTAAVLVFVFIPHYLELLGAESLQPFFELPLELPHPFKVLGALSGLALLIGSGMLVYRRWTNRDNVGANGYADHLFLYVLFLTGLTGMTSWLTRLTGIPMLAYANYFVHIVCVYFLLWYMPYSKFAHMFYRTLAIIHSRMIGGAKT